MYDDELELKIDIDLILMYTIDLLACTRGPER